MRVIILALLIILSSCSQKNTYCGTKKQKKQRHKVMKAGRAPGGGMLQ